MDTPMTPVMPTAADTTQAVVERPSSVRSSPLADRLKAEAEKSRVVRDKMADGEWTENVAYRKGKPFKEASSEHRVSVPVDWSFTKSKEAGLFSQVPQVILTPKHDKYKSAVPMFQRELNTVLIEDVKIDVTMEEALADVINAAGLAIVMCGYTATFEDTKVPSQDTSTLTAEQVQMAIQQGAITMLPVKKRVDCQFFGNRLSPSQALWATNFKGSDFDDADWVGYDGSCTWASGLREFGVTPERPDGLKPDMKEKACGGAETPTTLSDNPEQSELADDSEMMSYTRIFYWAARQDPDEKYLKKIKTIVWVNGIDKPVIHEDLPGQKWDAASKSFIGVTKYPLRFCTLTYISDTPVPPSDSEIGRPQVDEQNRSRQQIILQRDRSAPMRWGNINRIDPMIMASLMRGDDYQRIIPVNGDGNSAIGETARANYPAENWEFDRIFKQDQMDAWQVGPNQTGSFNTSGRTAAEANIVQSGFATRQAKERGKIAKFFCGIAEVVAGYMQVFHDVEKETALLGPDGVQRLGAWDRNTVAGAKFVFTIREDSTVKLDSSQRLQQIEKYLNLVGKSGFVNVQAVIEEYTSISGYDTAKFIVQPNPPKPEPPNISLRASGEDLQNPIVGPYLISLMQKGHPVTPEDVEAAKTLLIASSSEVAPPPMPGAPPGGPTAMPPETPQPPKEYGPMERVTKRVNEIGG